MFTLQILHASDLEGGVDAIARAPNFAAVLDALEEDAANNGIASITLSAGDNFIPGPFFNAGGDFSLSSLYEGFYNAFFGLIDTGALALVNADTNADGFFDNSEIETSILAGDITFDEAYLVDVNGDGFKDYFEEIDTFEGRIDIAIMNTLGFDASAVGNHEFDAGTDTFENIINFDSEEGNGLSSSRYGDSGNGIVAGHVNFLQEVDTPGAQFPYLTANLDFSSDFDVGALFQDNILPSTDFQSDLTSARDPQAGSEADFPEIFDTAGTSDSNDQKVAPATVIERDGEMIGVLGATTQLIASITSTGSIDDVSSPGVNDMAALAALLQPVVDDLTAMGVNKIVLVSHLQQFALEQELATLLANVDVIIAGGSDTILADETDQLRAEDQGGTFGDYPFETTDLNGNPVVVVSTDGEYSYLGRLVVDFDDNGILINRGAGELVDPDESGAFATDEAVVLSVTGEASVDDAIAVSGKATDVQNLTNAVTDIVIEIDSDVAGESEVFLNGQRSDVRTQETNFGNLTADANLKAVNEAGFNAMISIKNGGGIRAAIGVVDAVTGEELPTEANPLSGKQEGQISELDIDNSLRFDNGLVVVDLTIEQLKIILEHSVAETKEGATPGQFFQVGGIHVSFDPNGTAQELGDGGVPNVEGNRIQSVSLIDENGTPIKAIIVDGEVASDAPETIRVVTLNFLAGGGDGYPFEEFSEIIDTGIGEQKALSDFLRENFPEDGDTPFLTEDTDPGRDARIQIIGERSDTVDAPIATQDIRFERFTEFDSGVGADGAEVVAVEDNVLYVTNGEVGAIDIFDIASETKTGSIDLTTLDGFDGVQSVAVKNGIVAVAISRENESISLATGDFELAQPGFVAFFDAATTDLIGRVDVGNLPDQLTFNADGSKLFVANEGEFNEDNVDDDQNDPLGTVSIISLNFEELSDSTVDTLDFTAFSGAIEDALIAAGVRLQPGNSFPEDAEPEYITISPSGETAFVALQESNAIAKIDIGTQTVTDVFSVGVQDRSVIPFDANNDGIINIRTFDGVVSLRMPDAIDSFEIDGETYVITANEGDGRGFDEGDLGDVTLDPALEALLGEEALLELENQDISLIDGDTDGDGDIDVLHTFGGRSFTIFDEFGNEVFDSRSDFEKILAEIAPERFNDDDGDDGEDRSDNKGPEPEAVTVGVIDGQTYAFIGLERDSGIMIYDISDPANSTFVNYIPGVFVGTGAPGAVEAHSPEIISFISADESLSGNAQIAVSYEVSGTTIVYDLKQEMVAINELRIDQPSDDNNEYFELFGSAGAPLYGYSYVVIGDETDDGEGGGVEAIIDLSGQFIGQDGFFLVAESEDFFPATVDVDLIADLNFENSDNVTHLLVKNVDFEVGDDLDADDDGEIDEGFEFEVIDSIALIETPGEGDLTYSDTELGPDGSFVPAHAFRESDGDGEFQIGEFAPVFETDTPGFSNEEELPLLALTIMEIQGQGHISPFAGEVVETSGIVTAVGDDGYYLQDPDGDDNDLTSDAIFVFTDEMPSVMVGDEVVVRGPVEENIPGGAGTGNLSTTRIGEISSTVLSSGNSLPDATIIGAAGRNPPTDVVIFRQ